MVLKYQKPLKAFKVLFNNGRGKYFIYKDTHPVFGVCFKLNAFPLVIQQRLDFYLNECYSRPIALKLLHAPPS